MAVIKFKKHSAELLYAPEAPQLLERICRIARICTGVNKPITRESAERSVSMLIRRGHTSVLEHASVTVLLETSRAIANQLVRHRLGSYTQESLRYVVQNNDEFCVVPELDVENDTDALDIITKAVLNSIAGYNKLIKRGYRAEAARDALPLSTATKIVCTFNLRQLAHVLYDNANGRLTNAHAQPGIRKLMQAVEDVVMTNSDVKFILNEFRKSYGHPVVE
jgi:thymidylate synthase (FAD)